MVLTALKRHFPDVADIRKAYQMMDVLHDFVLVKPMVSEAPLTEEEEMTVPTLEKQLVDRISDKEYIDEAPKRFYQRVFEQYQVNISRLCRYAARKGKKEEVKMEEKKDDGSGKKEEVKQEEKKDTLKTEG